MLGRTSIDPAVIYRRTANGLHRGLPPWNQVHPPERSPNISSPRPGLSRACPGRAVSPCLEPFHSGGDSAQLAQGRLGREDWKGFLADGRASTGVNPGGGLPAPVWPRQVRVRRAGGARVAVLDPENRWALQIQRLVHFLGNFSQARPVAALHFGRCPALKADFRQFRADVGPIDAAFADRHAKSVPETFFVL